MRSHLALLLLSLCIAHAGADVSAHAQLAGAISIRHCLDTIDSPDTRIEAQCPGFLIEPLKQARQTCTDSGGQLLATPASNVWTIDVDGDAAPEYLFEYDGNVSCENAWSVFECGSLGCAKALYRKYAGAWRAIAEIWADSPEAIEILDARADQTYRDLRIGCAGEDPCNEYWYSQWTGEKYERTYLEVRGHRVEFEKSIHGLYGLVGEIDVLATPTAGAAVVGHYGADTEVAIVGTVAAADYYYVSPCNACESGFVPKAAVRALQW